MARQQLTAQQQLTERDADGRWTVMDGGWRVGNSTATDGSMVRTAMDGAMASQRRWAVDGDGRHDGDSTAMDGLTALDGNAWLCMVMDVSSTMMDGTARWQWTAHKLLDGEGRRNGDSTAMDNKEWRESDGD